MTDAVRRTRHGVVAAGLLLALLWFSLAPAQAATPRNRLLPGGKVRIWISTVPATPGLKFKLRGNSALTNRDGHAPLTVPRSVTFIEGRSTVPKLRDGVLPKLTDPRRKEGEHARLDRYFGAIAALGRVITVTPRFVDLQGKPVDPKLIQEMTIKSITGVRYTSVAGEPLVLPASRVVPFSSKLVSKELDYSIERVIVDGANVVNRAQQRFKPVDARQITVRLLFYSARFTSHDALLKYKSGSNIVLRYPNGDVKRHDFGPDGELTLAALPRGEYAVKVEGPGLSFEQPIAVSRSQVVELEIVSYVDLAIIGSILATIALGLLFAKRMHLLRMPGRRRG